MKRLLLPVLLLCSLPLFAQRTFKISQAAVLDRPAPQLLFAGSGSVAGANGTFFHSDITVLNYRATAQDVAFLWLPAGTSAAGVQPTVVTIPSASGVISEDLPGTLLKVRGLGALLITGVDANGNPDPNALLYATERVWTTQPGTTGTVSQTFPAVATRDINLLRATILGQRIDSRYRTNVGVVNLDSVDRQFEIVQTTDDPTTQTVSTTVTVPAMSMQQVPLQNLTSSALQIAVQPVTAINPALWMAYGSSVDNVTGDSWSSLGFQAR